MCRNLENERGDSKPLEPLALTPVKPDKQISIQVGRRELLSLPFKVSEPRPHLLGGCTVMFILLQQVRGSSTSRVNSSFAKP